MREIHRPENDFLKEGNRSSGTRGNPWEDRSSHCEEVVLHSVKIFLTKDTDCLSFVLICKALRLL